MHLLIILLQSVYTIAVTALAFYGFNALWLTWLAPRRVLTDRNKANINSQITNQLPSVTIQLPIYNERHVIERLIRACTNLDYPKEKLQIQILDDSTDQTSMITDRCAERAACKGYNIKIVRRTDRSGFKAGALEHAFPLAIGEFIAIFDADFVPPIDFLLRTVPHLQQNEQLGFLQTRWGHLNTTYSPLTRSQSLALDGHFVIEQAARQFAGYAFGFNGSAGIWRRDCIADPHVGGWQADTLCEDLDLSYRAQLVGWQPSFLPQIEVPAEIPPQLAAFKRQQFRWAKGSIQTLRKCGWRVWQSDWSFGKRVQALVHLAGYLLHPMLLLILLVSLPLTLLHINPAWPLAYLSIASIGPPFLYAVAQRRLHPQTWLQRWSYIGLLTLLGFGLSLNNTVAVIEACLGRPSSFLRTPKFHVEKSSDHWHKSSYRLPLTPLFWGEIALLLYAITTAIIAGMADRWSTLIFILLYIGGFGLMIGMELWERASEWVRRTGKAVFGWSTSQ